MRRIKICTISIDYRLRGSETWEKDVAFAEAEEKIVSAISDQPDLFLLPEAFLTGLTRTALENAESYEQEGNIIYTKFSELARRCNAYIAVPMLTQNNEGRHNSTVLFNRQGDVVYTYHKAYPTKEEIKANILPGSLTPECFDTDFGRIGIAICFDLQFHQLFEHYHNQGIELLLFPSYFPGGFILRTLAFQYSFFAVSSHAQGEESVFIDNYGRETSRAGLFTPALTQTINLDCTVLPISRNLNRIESIKSKYGPDSIDIEIHRPEGRMILQSITDSISIPELISEFNLTTLNDFFSNKESGK